MTTFAIVGRCFGPILLSLVPAIVASPLGAQEPDTTTSEIVLTVDPVVRDQRIYIYALEHTAASELGPILEEVINDTRVEVTSIDAGPDYAVDAVRFRARPAERTNSLLLSGTEAQIKQAFELLTRLDVAVEEGTTSLQVVELRHLPAQRALETIREAIRAEYDAPAQQMPDEGGTLRRRIAAPQIVANPTTNMLMFSGSPSQLLWIEHQIAQLEAAAKSAVADPAQGQVVKSVEPTSTGALSAPGFDVEIRDGVVHLRLNDEDGGEIRNFLELSERLLGKPILFHAGEFGEHNERIHFVGTLSIEQAKFRRLFEALIHSVGFGCIELGREDSFQAIEVVMLNGPQRGRVGTEARVVPLGHVHEYRDHSATYIAVTLPLEHLEVNQLMNYLRPFLASFGNFGQGGFSISSDGSRSLLLAGAGTHIASVVDLVMLADRAAGEAKKQNEGGR